MRLYFASFSDVLMHGRRRLGPTGTELGRAQASTIRRKRLKIGTPVRITEHKVWLSFPPTYADTSAFAQILANPRARPPWVPSG